MRRRRDTFAPALPGTGDWASSPAPWAGRLAVLVTTLDEGAYSAVALARLYRERADAENVYDELKNRWGWCGYTTQKLAPSRLMANLIALVYNWGHLYARLYDGEHHREAITSRPALLHGVARLTRSGGQRTVKVSIQHEKSGIISAAICAFFWRERWRRHLRCAPVPRSATPWRASTPSRSHGPSNNAGPCS